METENNQHSHKSSTMITFEIKIGELVNWVMAVETVETVEGVVGNDLVSMPQFAPTHISLLGAN